MKVRRAVAIAILVALAALGGDAILGILATAAALRRALRQLVSP